MSPYGRCGALTSLMRKVLKLSAMAPRRQRVKMAVILLVPCRDEKVFVNDGIEMFFDLDEGCGRFDWSVLDWNQPAIDFYEGLGAEVMPDWRICRLSGDALQKAAQ